MTGTLIVCGILGAACVGVFAFAMSCAVTIRAAETERLRFADIRNAGEAVLKTDEIDPKLAGAGVKMSRRTWNVLVIMAAAGVLAFALFGSWFASLAGVLAVLAGQRLLLGLKRRSRASAFAAQLTMALPQIAESMRSGSTLDRAMAAVAEHAQEPLKSEFAACSAEIAYSPDTARAIGHMAERTGCKDLVLLSAAARVHQQRGGNMAPTMDAIADTMTKRLSMRRYVRSETANAKTSMLIVAALPLIVLAMQCATNASYSTFYFETVPGWVVLGVCAALEVIGTIVMMKMADVKVD